jgi:hypothetical protein
MIETETTTHNRHFVDDGEEEDTYYVGPFGQDRGRLLSEEGAEGDEKASEK